MSPLRALRERIWPTPTGRRRATPATVPYATFFPPAPTGAAFVQGWRYCPPCGTDAGAVLHRDGSFTCSECSTTTHPDEGGE